MNYEEWSSLKTRNKVQNFTYGTGIIISDIGIGYVVKFNCGKIVRISDGSLENVDEMLFLCGGLF